MEHALLPVCIFLAVYIALSFEILNKAVAAVLGVMTLLVFRVIDMKTAVTFIDFETIMLLMGMMIIVAVLKKAEVFTILSVKIAELTRGEPLKILLLFSVVTAVLSAFLDNVTTVLIIIPVIIELTAGMGLNPKVFILSQIVISNIGGAATLIGDPPNIIIGSKAGITFNQFIVHLIIPVTISFFLVLFYIWVRNRSLFKPIRDNLATLFSARLLFEKIRHDFLNTLIRPRFLKTSIAFLGMVIMLFFTQTITHISPGEAAVLVAMLLLAATRVKIEPMLEEVEWSTLLFFAGLFILVGTLEHVGVIEWVAKNVFMRVGDNPYVATLTILWVSAIISGFLDNIPFTLAMIPIVQMMIESTGLSGNILWWALSLGACFGGNFTMIGASANIVGIGMAKKYNQHITFLEFMKFSAVATLLSLIVASIYLSLYLWIIL